MEQKIQIVLPEGVSANMPFSGTQDLTKKQTLQIRISEPLATRVLEITRTVDLFEWRYGCKTYSTALADIRSGRVDYGTFGGVPFLEFVLHDQPNCGYILLTYAPGNCLPGSTELGLEGWLHEFARILTPFVPGGVTVALEWPLNS